MKNTRKKISDKIHLNIIKTEKFKSNLISIYIIRPLKKEEATKNALLPLILRRGTQNYKTSIEIEKKLEELYGSNLSLGVSKKGEKQVIRLTIEGPSKEYIDIDDIFEKQISLLNEILNNPLKEENSFLSKFIEQEKKNLKDKIVGRINSKKQYAVDRCIEEMCEDEPFGIYKYGSVEDLNKINDEELFSHYEDILKSSPIEISIVGNVDEEYALSTINNIFDFKRSKVIETNREKVIKNIKKTKEKIDEMNVNQGKLTIGYRTNIPYEDKLYESFLVGSSILGGGPESKLFINVREKESLAYYIYTKSYKFKSIMLIASGIEFKNYKKTLDIVKEQVENMKNGEFTLNEIEQSKKSIITSIKNMIDDSFSISEFYLSQSLTNDDRTIEDIIDKINNVEKNQIIEAIKKLELDTIYFLKNKE